MYAILVIDNNPTPTFKNNWNNKTQRLYPNRCLLNTPA